MKSRAPQLHLEYRYYKLLGNTGKKCSRSNAVSIAHECKTGAFVIFESCYTCNIFVYTMPKIFCVFYNAQSLCAYKNNLICCKIIVYIKVFMYVCDS